MKTRIFIWLLILSPGIIFGQGGSVKPLQPGNKWFYTQTGYAHGGFDLSGYPIEEVTDSTLILNDILYHAISNGSGYYLRYEMSDSTGVVYLSKYTEQRDRIWDYSYSIGDTIFGMSGISVILDRYDTLMFNEFTDLISIKTTTNYFNLAPVTYIKAVRGLGIVYQYVPYLLDYTLTRYLRGALINGISYGDTSVIISSVKEKENVSKNFILFQNYPNPFNPSTKIKYKIPISGNVEIKIYNALGKEIDVLVNSYKDKGIHEVEFDGRDLASGVYIYRINAGSYSEAKLMVLLK